jgi:hypothetical protein
VDPSGKRRAPLESMTSAFGRCRVGTVDGRNVERSSVVSGNCALAVPSRPIATGSAIRSREGLWAGLYLLDARPGDWLRHFARSRVRTQPCSFAGIDAAT